MLTGNPGHLASFDYRGLHRYFLTFCTNGRRSAFLTHSAVNLVLEQIEHAAAIEAFAISAYCFMPDHVHLLVAGLIDVSDCRRFIRRAKQYSGFYYAKTLGVRLWQRYGYERVLRNDEASMAVAKYIFMNPVRAALVDHPRDYSFLGSRVYSVDAILEAAGDWRRSDHGPAKAGHYA